MSDFKKDGYTEYTIFRRRFIPNERIELKHDRIYLLSPDRIVTAWQALKPRADIAGGLSVYYPEAGYKISKFYDHEHELVHWYCDIMRLEFCGNRIEYEDLLLDVIVCRDGSRHILDADELADALEQGLITQEMACLALRRLDSLLRRLYEGSFPKLLQPVLDLEHELFPEHTAESSEALSGEQRLI